MHAHGPSRAGGMRPEAPASPVASGTPSPARSRARAMALRFAAVLALLGCGLLAGVAGPVAGAIPWGFLVLASWVGWGTVVERVAAPAEPADWALRAAWGMALVLATGGALCAAHVATRPVLLAQVVVGALVAAVDVVMPPGARRRRVLVAASAAPAFGAIAAVSSMVAAMHVLGSAGSLDFNPSDDLALYFFLPEEILQTGSLVDPFTVRRLSTYGGQSYLHATLLVGTPHTMQHLLDAGLGVVLVAGLVLGELGRARRRSFDAAHAALAMLLVFAVGDVRINTTSLETSVAMLLAVFRTLGHPWTRGEADDAATGRRLAVVGGLAAAACLLRTSNAIGTVVFVGLAILLAPPPARARPRSLAHVRGVARSAAAAAGSFVVVMAPWMWLMARSSGTALYPLQKGRLSTGFYWVEASPELAVNFDHLVRSFFFDRPLATASLFALAGLLPFASRRRRDVVAITAGALVGAAAMVWEGGGFSDFDAARYYFGPVVAAAIAIAMTPAEPAPALDRRAALVLAAIAIHVVASRENLAEHYRRLVYAIARGLGEGGADARSDALATSEYRELQRHLPAGEPVLAMTDEAWRFDLRRNPVYPLDVPGGIGPAPGFPAFRGAETLARYLLSHGVRWLVHVEPDRSIELYQESRWRFNATRADYLGGQALFVLDVLRSVQQLDQSRQVAYRGFGMVVLDLQTMRP